MAKKQHAVEANWVELNPATDLTAEQATAYADYKTAYRLMKEARGAFDDAMQVGVPEGERMIISHQFGKLKTDIVPDTREADKPKVSEKLAAWLAARAANGQSA